MPKPPTRADLEKRIADLQLELDARTASIKKLALDDGMMIVLPARGSKTLRGAAPHFHSARRSAKDKWESAVIPTIAAALKEHGVPVEHTGHRKAFGTKEKVVLGRIDWHNEELEYIVVPKLVGRLIASLLDGTAAFASQCYAEGFESGADLLARVQRGEISVDEFDGSVEQEKAQDQQRREERGFEVKKV